MQKEETTMSIEAVISRMEREMFAGYINPPEPPLKEAYVSYDKDNEPWLTCPMCGKKQLKIQKDTKITHLTIVCKNSKCRHEIPVEIK